MRLHVVLKVEIHIADEYLFKITAHQIVKNIFFFNQESSCIFGILASDCPVFAPVKRTPFHRYAFGVKTLTQQGAGYCEPQC